MRIAYCGHSHHRTTGSSRFLLQALRGLGEVEEYWSETWRGGGSFDPAPLVEGGHDAVVVWQMESVALELARAGLPNVTFFPMYDSCHAYPDSYWRRLESIKVVCFSSTLHARLQRLGLRSRFVQYHPELPPAVVTETPGLAGYFWRRQRDLTWETIRPLLRDATFRQLTLHDAPDPSCAEAAAPGAEDVARYRLRITRWFPTRTEAAADLARHNVYFAPRLREGIGMSFLEAMAAGFLVVAPDRPTMNEYVVSGVNGILYDPATPRPLDFSHREELGRRARQSAEIGRERWCRAVPALLELIATPTREVPLVAPFDALDPRSRRTPSSAAPGNRPEPAGAVSSSAREEPLVTVAVVARNAAGALSETLEAALGQDWARLNVVVLDRASRDGTLDVVRRYQDRIAGWRTTPDGGGAAAMNQAAEAATGGYVIFLRPGDRFPTSDAVSRALRHAPADADLIYGHRLASLGGREELLMADDLQESHARLLRGELSWSWLTRLPGRPAMLWRAETVRELRFREDLRLAPSQELLCRLLQRGGRVHHALTALAAYPARRSSRPARAGLLEEWRPIALAHTRSPQAVRTAFDRMGHEARALELHWLTLLDLLAGVGTVPGTIRELKRRLRAWQAAARAARRSATTTRAHALDA